MKHARILAHLSFLTGLVFGGAACGGGDASVLSRSTQVTDDEQRDEQRDEGEQAVREESAVASPDGGGEVSIGDVDGNPVMEGDILLAPGRPSVAGNASASKPWPGGIVAYAIDEKLTDQKRVTDAIAHWEQRTQLRFVVRKTEAAYVMFQPGKGCNSFIGRQGAKQAINLADGCTTGNTIHEIGHAVGLWHEQSRSDRDKYVTVLLDNVEKDQEHNFQKTTFTSVGSYDVGSIMQYGSMFFSVDPKTKPTLTKLDGTLITAQRSALSAGDLAGIELIYANEKLPAKKTGGAIGTATTTAALNLRSGAGTGFSILAVIPQGAKVALTGKSQSGFDSLTYGGRSGWAYATYLRR